MSMLEDRAKELGRLIGQSPEYQAVKRANDALGEDREAVALLREMEKLRMDAQRMISSGQQPTSEMEQQLDRLLEQVQRLVPYDSASMLLVDKGRTRTVRMRGYEKFGAAWTEKTRGMFAGLYRDYALGKVDDRCFTHTV
jgi:cell fate (sporulation/competence/biofilm development) regulator YlbF (YheA/YmcA/DUF963 family)